jgi:hypothetical protein
MVSWVLGCRPEELPAQRIPAFAVLRKDSFLLLGGAAVYRCDNGENRFKVFLAPTARNVISMVLLWVFCFHAKKMSA